MSSRLFILLKSFFLSGKERDTKSRPWVSGPIRPHPALGWPTFILVDLVDHAPQGLNVLGQLLQLVQVLLLLSLVGASWAHDRAGVHYRGQGG